MPFLSGPFNIQQGNSAQFTVEFMDSAGSLSVPPSASMSITYVDTSGFATTQAITLSQTGSFFTGTWSSTSAALGLATWTALTSLSTVEIAMGQLRIIQRMGG